MNITTGQFDDVEGHHEKWFRVFKFKYMIEIWFGKNWISLDWGK